MSRTRTPDDARVAPPSRWRRTRTATVGVVAVLAVGACAGTGTPAQEAGAATAASDGFTATSHDERLVVADPGAAAVHVFSVPEHELLDTLEGVAVNDHAGFLQLEDGRLLAASSAPDELLALDVTGDEVAVVDSIALPGGAVHIAVDPEDGVAAVSTSADPGTGLGAVTVVDLAGFERVGAVELSTEEPGIALVGGALLHRDGASDGRLEALSLAEVRDGPAEPTAEVEVGAYGHGEAVVDGHLVLATDVGLERFHVDEDHLAAEDVVPWGPSGRDWGRAYYLRVHDGDAPQVWSYVRDQASERWADWRNDVWVLEAGQDAPQRRALGNGLAFRFALSEDRALFARMHPDGYAAHVVDADPGSPTFLETLHDIALPTPTAAPGPDDDLEAIWGSPGRPIAALASTGELGYVSRGGDGIIDVLDLRSGRVSGTITVPTSLDGGGYLVTARPGIELVDGLGR